MKKTLLIGFFIMMALSVWAADFSLSEKYVKSLNPEALAFYQKGLGEMDYVRYETALVQFVQAQKADPQNVGIRFLIARLSENEARKKMGEEALTLYRQAETAMNEVIALKDKGAKASEVKNAEIELDIIRDRIIKQAERDQRHLKIGKEIVKERAKEIFAAQIKAQEKKLADKLAKEKEKQDKVKKAGATPTPGFAAANPMMMMQAMGR